MVVTRFLLAMPVAHRPGVHQLIVENVVLIGAAHRRLVPVRLARIARRRNQLRGAAVHAESVLRGPVDEAFRINRAAQVDMQIAALGHLLQKCQQQSRLMTHRFQILRRLLLRALRPGNLCQRKNGQETNDGRQTQTPHHKKASNHESSIVEDLWPKPQAAAGPGLLSEDQRQAVLAAADHHNFGIRTLGQIFRGLDAFQIGICGRSRRLLPVLVYCPRISGKPFLPPPITTILAFGLLARFSVASMPFHSSNCALMPWATICWKSRTPVASIRLRSASCFSFCRRKLMASDSCSACCFDSMEALSVAGSWISRSRTLSTMKPRCPRRLESSSKICLATISRSPV